MKKNYSVFDGEKLQKQLHNYTEDFVIEYLEEMLEKNEQFKDVCTCEQCLLDIASFALSRLPAKYISSSKGNLHTKLQEFEQQLRVDLYSTLTRAINLVKENPRH